MSKRRKKQFRFFTFAIFPVLLGALALLPAFLSASSPADAMVQSEWNYVADQINGFVSAQIDEYSSQGNPFENGEGGFIRNSVVGANQADPEWNKGLKGQLDSNNDGVYLGEGDDIAKAPVLVDVYTTDTKWIPGTGATSRFGNSTAATDPNPGNIKTEVDKHTAAGISTDIVLYCLTGHTESPPTMAYGAMSAAGYFGTPNPKVYALRWGRAGWGTTAAATYGSPVNSTTATAAANGNSTPTIGADCANGNTATTVKCRAAAGLTAVTSGANPPGVGGSTWSFTANLPVDIREGASATYPANSGAAYTVPIQLRTLFSSTNTYENLKKLPVASGTNKNTFVANTQHTAAMAATGAAMLYYPSTYMRWGLPSWNNTDYTATYTSSKGYQYWGAAGTTPGGGTQPTGGVDIVAPTINNTTGTGATGNTAANIVRNTSEPATSKIALTGSDGHVVDGSNGTLNSTVLNVDKTTSLTGLHEGVTYTGTLTVYDGMANSATADISFTTTATAPSITNLAPSTTLNDVTATTITADFSDASGIAAVSVYLGGSVTPEAGAGCTSTTSPLSCAVSGLAIGAHPYSIKVLDNANQESTASSSFTTADTVAPAVSNVLPAEGTTIYTTSTAISGDFTDASPSSGIDAGTVMVHIDTSQMINDCTFINTSGFSCNTSSLGPLAYGAHTIDIWNLKDNATNTATPNPQVTHFNVGDNVAPVITNVQPSGTIGTSSTTVTASYSDAAPTSGIDTTTAKIYLDGSVTELAGCTVGATDISCPSGTLADGPHTIVVNVSDNDANPGTAGGAFTIDTSAPTVTPDSFGYQPGNWTGDTTPTVSATISGVPGGQNINSATVTFDKGTGSEYICSGGETSMSNTAVSCTPTTALSAGTHSVELKAEYSLNHPGSGTVIINVDTTAPAVTNIMPNGSSIVSNTAPTITADYSDAGSGINSSTSNVKVDGTTLGTCSASGIGVSCTTTGLSQGAHDVQVIINDNVGNSQTTATGSFTVDSIAPSVTGLLPSGLTNNATPTVSANYSDSGVGVDSATAAIVVDGTTTLTGCTALAASISCPTSGLSQGAHTFAVTVDDLYSNTGSSSGGFTIDTVNPAVSALSPSGPTGTASPTITADYSDGGSGINSATATITLDGTVISSGCTATGTGISCTTSGLADGAHPFSVDVEDIAGNPGTASGSFTVDTAAPSVTGLSPNGDTSGTPTITANFADTGGTGIDAASAVVYLDGAPVSGCAPTTSAISCTLSGVTPNVLHNYSVYIDDNAGNTGNASSSFTLTELNYFFPWYDNIGGDNWILMANPTAALDDLNFDLRIGGTAMDMTEYNNGVVTAGNSISPKYNGMIGGPVKATSTNGGAGIVSQRVLWPKGGNSLEEVLATDEARLSNHLWWSWYDEVSPGYQNWVLVANPSAAADVYYEIKVAGVVKSSGTISPSANVSPDFPGVMGGPVEVQAWTDSGKGTPANVLASQRVLSNGGMAFNEVPGIPDSELSAHYLWTWYDEASPGSMDWVLIANPATLANGSANPNDMYYQIRIDGTLMEQGGPIAPGQKVTPRFGGSIGGPVDVQTFSDAGFSTPLRAIASQRVTWGPSFEEVPGYDFASLGSSYNWTWYDESAPGVMNWVLVANPSNSATVTYDVKVGGITRASGTLGPNEAATPDFAGLMGGPVEVTSSSGNVMVSQRVLWKGHFNETLGTGL